MKKLAETNKMLHGKGGVLPSNQPPKLDKPASVSNPGMILCKLCMKIKIYLLDRALIKNVLLLI